MSDSLTIRPGSSRHVASIDLSTKAATKVLGGCIVDTDAAGYALHGPGGVRSWGRATKTADNTVTGAAPIVNVELAHPLKVQLFANDTGSPLTRADVGRQCYVLDNQTLTGSSSTGDPGPFVYEVTSDGVWAWFAPMPEIDSGLQIFSGTLQAGVLTKSTGINVSSSTKVIGIVRTLAGGTFAPGFDALAADMVVGAPGVGTVVIRARKADGTAETGSTATVNITLKG